MIPTRRLACLLLSLGTLIVPLNTSAQEAAVTRVLSPSRAFAVEIVGGQDSETSISVVEVATGQRSELFPRSRGNVSDPKFLDGDRLLALYVSDGRRGGWPAVFSRQPDGSFRRFGVDLGTESEKILAALAPEGWDVYAAFVSCVGWSGGNTLQLEVMGKFIPKDEVTPALIDYDVEKGAIVRVSKPLAVKGTKASYPPAKLRRPEDHPRYSQIDESLNAMYRRLRGLLDAKGQADLREGQREWIAKRDTLRGNALTFVKETEARNSWLANELGKREFRGPPPSMGKWKFSLIEDEMTDSPGAFVALDSSRQLWSTVARAPRRCV